MAHKAVTIDRQTVIATREILKTDSEEIFNRHKEMMNFLDEREKTEINFLKEWVAQIDSGRTTGPLMPKTPKPGKRAQRIKTIPEEEVMNDSHLGANNIKSENIAEVIEKSEMSEEEEVKPARSSRRAASQKANEIMKKQQSLSMATKLRRDSDGHIVIGDVKPNQTIRPSRSKRPKNSLSCSEEDEYPPSKVSKTSLKPDTKKRARGKKIKEEATSDVSPEEIVESPPKKSISPEPKEESPVRRTRSSSLKNATITHQKEENTTVTQSDTTKTYTKTTTIQDTTFTQPSTVKTYQKETIIDETLDLQDNDATITEPSLYEDAIGKSIPMNSTMNPNTTMTIDRKMMNATVVLEKLMNDTVTLNHQPSITAQMAQQARAEISPVDPVPQSKLRLKSKLQALKESLVNQEFEALVTDDDSSPERKGTSKNTAKHRKNKQTITKSVSSDEEDDVLTKTPPKYQSKINRQMLNEYKPAAIFSPYAKESVKKKVEAFEQAVQNSPKTDIDAPRLTRTKTRAMAAAKQTPTILAGKLARKSLAKAKKMSQSRQKKESEDGKENLLASATKIKYQSGSNDKVSQKQNQRTTPVSKSRLLMPMSVNRIYNTPASQIPAPKVMTASKLTHASSESFASSKPLSKSSSTDSLAEKKRQMADEDARRKKEEQLRALTEEKKRKREEKELKNKLAREAKEKLEQERRLKMEKEREEKAKQALIAQEKMKEELEKKKLAQLQRAQEKEEKRRQEEQLRLEKIREQEEAERQLAEQKRKEQEAEKKRMIEARNQQMAVLESMKLKQQLMAKAKQMQSKDQGPTTYVLESDPDDDESEDESKPKYTIPTWARAEVRKPQLQMQQYIPMGIVLDFFGAKKSTPNLAEFFVGIKKDRLMRTSSANWKTPPRFSMMDEF